MCCETGKRASELKKTKAVYSFAAKADEGVGTVILCLPFQ